MSKQKPNGREKQKTDTLAVIGGGPAGLFAAITAAAESKNAGYRLDIRVYDKNAAPARKLLASGNGRCNLSNAAVSAANYPGVQKEWFNAVYAQFSNEALFSFFRQNGLPLKADAAGRVYPRSAQASGVYNILLFLCGAWGINLVAETEIVSVERRRGAFVLNGSILADRVIFACGSAAAPRNGGKNSLVLLSRLGVETQPFLPALCPIKIKQFSKNQLKGVRADGEIAVWQADECLTRDRGEIQYTEYGLSGIPAMQVSGASAKAAANGTPPEITVDSLPDFDDNKLRLYISDGRASLPGMPAAVFFAGIFPRRLAVFFLKQSGISADQTLSSLSPAQTERVVQAIKRQRYPFEAVCGFADAQAASGGVSAKALDPATLELKTVPGCYVCGEMADVVGECGGYNLQWAWSSGYVAGKHAARRKSVDPDQ